MPFLEVFFSAVFQFSVTLLNPVTSDAASVFDYMNPLSISIGNSSVMKRSIFF
jgi:capsule polysaccharide export protein KpsC/LpsZ